MLYDPKWEQKTKAGPFTLPSLIAWLEQQPASKRYSFSNCSGECIFSQYLRTVDDSYRFGDGSYARFCECVSSSIAREHPQTFGAALQRARAIQRS